MKKLIMLLIGTLGIICSCQNQKTETDLKVNLTIDKDTLNKFKWNELADTTKGQVYYLQLNFSNFPEDNYIGKDIMDFKDSITKNAFLLNGQQRKELYKLISDSSNFHRAADCGTFHLNAGFIIADRDKVRATINIGCGYNQWNFNPYNPDSKNNSFNEKGFKQMEKLLDDINSSVEQSDFFTQLANAALALTKQKVQYDPAYFQIPYPNGDIPSDKGVCTDVVIRAYRKLGIDLQKEVHEDMKANFDKYPKQWGLPRPDTNIDHRRVPNLMTFFSRHGTIKKISQEAKDYQSGDIVCWDLGKGVTHIGIVSGKKSADGQRYLIVHNIGAGQVLEDCLFRFKIIGHYSYKK